MRRLYLKDAAPGDIIDDVFVITNKQFSTTTNGKYFIKAFLSDSSGQATARLWNATRDIFNSLPESGLLRVRGHVENYQGNLQLIIEQTAPPKEGSYDIADLMPHTKRDIDQMRARVIELIGTIRNHHLAGILHAYLADQALMTDFCRAPAAMSFHHAFVGGLLEHTLNAMEVADAVCKFYVDLNRDIVLAGIFLHDIAKTWELKYDCAVTYTDGGQLVGHVVKSAIWLELKSQEASLQIKETIPRPLIDVLQHIILSHHGLPEFGAARVPSTPEAIAVHMIENMDAKLMMSLSATRQPAISGGEGNWTEYMKAFSGRLYRPDVAPSDMPEPAAAASEPPPPALAPDPATPGNPGKPLFSNPHFEVQARKR